MIHFKGGNNWKFDVIVTGVLEDIPDNSHLHFDFLISFASLYAIPGNKDNLDWWNHSFYTYIELEENHSSKDFEKKLIDFTNRYDPMVQFGQKPGELVVQPLEEIHCNTDCSMEIADTNSINII